MLRQCLRLPVILRTTAVQQRLSCVRWVHYVQGQSPTPRTREYFYYIDHQGQLFLDDARIKNFTSCFKEKDFLEFFFKRVTTNDSGRYEEDFPYLSPCGREKNYIRCDDLPIVFTHIISDETNGDRLSYSGAGDRLTVLFEPERICMLPESGRIYHPGPAKTGGVGLIKSALAIELSKFFDFGSGCDTDPPTHFTWKEKKYKLTNELYEQVRDHSKKIIIPE